MQKSCYTANCHGLIDTSAKRSPCNKLAIQQMVVGTQLSMLETSCFTGVFQNGTTDMQKALKLVTLRRYYRPQTKLREGNVFIPVCHSVHRGSRLAPPAWGGVGQQTPLPCWHVVLMVRLHWLRPILIPVPMKLLGFVIMFRNSRPRLRLGLRPRPMGTVPIYLGTNIGTDKMELTHCHCGFVSASVPV